jgi:DDE superfamily endonuclease
MCPLYVLGLIGPGDRKSIAPIAQRLALGDYDQLHHFIVAGVWDATPSQQGGKKRINGPPPQPTLPAVRQAILKLIAQPPQRCPHCRKWICNNQRR